MVRDPADQGEVEDAEAGQGQGQEHRQPPSNHPGMQRSILRRVFI